MQHQSKSDMIKDNTTTIAPCPDLRRRQQCPSLIVRLSIRVKTSSTAQGIKIKLRAVMLGLLSRAWHTQF